MVHAAGESSPGDLTEGTNAVVLTARDEAALCRLADAMRDAGVQLTRIFEPDLQYAGALMAIGLVVTDRKEVRRWLSAQPLLR